MYGYFTSQHTAVVEERVSRGRFPEKLVHKPIGS